MPTIWWRGRARGLPTTPGGMSMVATVHVRRYPGANRIQAASSAAIGSTTAGGPPAAQCQAVVDGRLGRFERPADRQPGDDGGADDGDRRRPASPGRSRRAARRWRPPRPGANPATTGIAATASSCPVRATALLTPEAMPACSSSTAPSAVAVSGATVSDRPRPNTTMPGRIRRDVAALRRDAGQQQHRRGDEQRPDGHRDARADALGERAGPRREQEHRQRDRHRRRAGLQRRVPERALQHEAEEEEHDAERAVQQQRHDVRAAERRRPEQRQRHERVARAPLDRARTRRARTAPTTASQPATPR